MSTLLALAHLAAAGKTGEVLAGLAKRLDEAVEVRYTRAVKAYNYRTDHPKASWSECEGAGETEAPPLPETPESFITALTEWSREVEARRG